MGVQLSINGKSLVTFVHAGKSFIGRLYSPTIDDGHNTQNPNLPAVVTEAGSILGSFIPQEKRDDYYFIEGACVVEYEISKPKTGSAQLKWNLVPMFYKALLGQTPHQIMFAFPKSQTVLCSVADDYLNSKLVAAWKELCESL